MSESYLRLNYLISVNGGNVSLDLFLMYKLYKNVFNNSWIIKLYIFYLIFIILLFDLCICIKLLLCTEFLFIFYIIFMCILVKKKKLKYGLRLFQLFLRPR